MNQIKTPVAGDVYRHFKGNLYQIIGIAKHSETEENMVVYQALHGEKTWYVRPLDMFLSQVDKEQYPSAEQEYRFEKTEETGSEETVRKEILRFLDAEGASEKLKVLQELRLDLDESLLTTIELSLDIVSDGKESMERRYDFVERTLEQRIRFEGSRLR